MVPAQILCSERSYLEGLRQSAIHCDSMSFGRGVAAQVTKKLRLGAIHGTCLFCIPLQETESLYIWAFCKRDDHRELLSLLFCHFLSLSVLSTLNFCREQLRSESRLSERCHCNQDDAQSVTIAVFSAPPPPPPPPSIVVLQLSIWVWKLPF